MYDSLENYRKNVKAFFSYGSGMPEKNAKSKDDNINHVILKNKECTEQENMR